MQIGLFVRDEAGQLQPIDTPGQLPVIPRIGETISFMAGKLSAKVEAVDYRMPGTPGPALVAVILDRAPSLDIDK
jgi:hypothetical protein